MDALVVGAGLAGLLTAEILHANRCSVRVLEARSRVGGRIWTITPEGLGDETRLDVGATWHWTDQPKLRDLAARLGVATFPQFREGRAMTEESSSRPPEPVDLPPPSPGELLCAGGAQTLCERLADRLGADRISLETQVLAIGEAPGGLTVTVDGPDGEEELVAPFVVVTLPPRLASECITFTPALPADLVKVMRATPTWMGRSMKCVVVYESPFWRDAGLSGLAISSVGPLTEIHDACNEDRSVAALWGFVSPHHDFRDLEPGDRVEKAIAQLGRLFGPPGADPVGYFERDWSSDPNTADTVWWFEGDLLDYGDPRLLEPQMGGRLVWAGTETSDVGGGHMEGAVRSAQRAAAVLLDARRSS